MTVFCGQSSSTGTGYLTVSSKVKIFKTTGSIPSGHWVSLRWQSGHGKDIRFAQGLWFWFAVIMLDSKATNRRPIEKCISSLLILSGAIYWFFWIVIVEPNMCQLPKHEKKNQETKSMPFLCFAKAVQTICLYPSRIKFQFVVYIQSSSCRRIGFLIRVIWLKTWFAYSLILVSMIMNLSDLDFI